ncbi:T9SS type A sorting domain-containing protein [Chryseolinea sp. H1M3-3]|uniref:T9SS type A sorting domain-containing protein n=1 Tax=Chryseolinea sp. H1M3-3 TaxID=3034144 RepID=UPI0023EB2A04|nr:T9SS type A sorting domain-containing protein [Chryseolinea sp. H1M3-3]
MKKLMIDVVLCVVIFSTSPLWAQKIIPYNFYHQTDSSAEGSLQVITTVNASSNFLRLYFKGTQLGKESYLVLETADGAKQKLHYRDLENWGFSSAYFNGNAVKVSLYTGKGDMNKIIINAVKVSDGEMEKSTVKDVVGRKNVSSQPAVANSDINYELPPHAAAVGRFTNGNKSYGTGWIAPNGAIVTSQRVAYNLVQEDGYDVIEFNIPPSNHYGSVNHPGPDDQYPVNINKRDIGSENYNYKRKHDFDIENEDGYGEWHTTWGIIEALPNSTGLRPGERQQHHFQIVRNPGSFTLESTNVWVDIFHYGEITTDLIYESQYRTLKTHVTKLLPSEEYLTSNDHDNFVLYNKDNGDITLSDSDTGAPIAYNQFNIAIGVHDDFLFWPPAVGTGFRNSELLNGLDHFFSSDVVYVDQNSFWDSSTGAIDKPYFQVLDAIDHADISGIVSIAKGTYDEPMYVTKAVTLKAPVGKVVIGEEGVFNTRKATLPRELFLEPETAGLQGNLEENDSGFDLKSFPNPFTLSTEINYSLEKSSGVDVSVYDNLGNKIKSLVHEKIQSHGYHSVVWDGNNESGLQAMPGLYVIRIETGSQSKIVKVIKN